MSKQPDQQENRQQNEPPSQPVQDQPPTAAPCAGDRCPRCSVGILAFDGLLNLACPQCRYTDAACFT